MMTERLRQLRKAAKLTQSQVAERLSIRQNTYSEYETGNSHPPVETLAKLADMYDVTVDYMIGRTSDTKPPDYKDLTAGLTDKEADELCQYAQWIQVRRITDESKQTLSGSRKG